MPTIAVDANVWYSVTLTDAILTLAELGVFAVVTSAEALRETDRNTTHITGAQARIESIASFLADNVIDVDPLQTSTVKQIGQINQKDRHVYAAAILGEASLILTIDTGFSAELRTIDFNARTPDEFLGVLAEQQPKLAFRVLQRMAAQRRRPPLNVEQVRSRYEHTAPRFFLATSNLTD